MNEFQVVERVWEAQSGHKYIHMCRLTEGDRLNMDNQRFLPTHFNDDRATYDSFIALLYSGFSKVTEYTCSNIEQQEAIRRVMVPVHLVWMKF